jgi:hypothetical protein
MIRKLSKNPTIEISRIPKFLHMIGTPQKIPAHEFLRMSGADFILRAGGMHRNLCVPWLFIGRCVFGEGIWCVDTSNMTGSDRQSVWRSSQIIHQPTFEIRTSVENKPGNFQLEP